MTATVDDIKNKLKLQEHLLEEALHRMVILKESRSDEHLESILQILNQIAPAETVPIRALPTIDAKVAQTMKTVGQLFEGTLVIEGMIEQAEKEGKPVEPILKKLGIWSA